MDDYYSNMEFDDDTEFEEEDGRFAGMAIMEAVDNQINSDELPEAKETYDRLISLGCSDEDARKHISRVLATEIYCILKYKREFHRNKYVHFLKALPDFDENGYEASEKGYKDRTIKRKFPSKKKKKKK